MTYRSGRGERSGLLAGERVYDVADRTGVADDATVLGLLRDWPRAKDRVRLLVLGDDDGERLNDVRLLAPLPHPGAIYGAGANYSDHAAEMAAANRAGNGGDDGRDQRPWHFLKSPHTVVGPDESIELPDVAARLDWEVELAAIVGIGGKHIAVGQALSHIAGYTIAIDLSARGLSRREGLPIDSPFRMDWLSHKNFDGACPLGPWIVLAEDIKDPQRLALALSVNGRTKQSANTAAMIFSVGEQVSWLSERMTLWPGDVILTGTPAGVGMGRNEFLRAGDVITATIEGMGELAARIVEVGAVNNG